MTKSAAILASIVLALGCDGGGAGDDAGPGDAGSEPDACASCARDAGPDDAGPIEDGNDTFATATEIPFLDETTDPAMGVIDPPGDLDYYRFEGTAGQWINVLTLANPDDDTTMLDTVVTLYDSSMSQIAENDDLLPRTNTDSQLVTRLPADGTYYVLVQDFSTWSGAAPAEGMPSFVYYLALLDVSTGGAPLNHDAEAGNDAAHAQAVAFSDREYATLLGTFADDADVDVYSFTIPAPGTRLFEIDLRPGGITGNGSAAAPPRLWVASADGADVIARIAPPAFEPIGAGGYVSFRPQLPAGDYTLFVEGGGGADFYDVLLMFRGEDSGGELDERANDTPGGAQAIAFSDVADTPAGTSLRRGFVLAQLGAIDAGTLDTDYFSVELAEGEELSVSCSSRSQGSGVVDLQVTLIGPVPDSTEILSATETATQSARFLNQAVPSAGTYLVRLTKASQDPELSGTYVRCGFYADVGLPVSG